MCVRAYAEEMEEVTVQCFEELYDSLTRGTRFESDTSASRAKQQLDGADIYAGCCTLKIEFAKVCSQGSVLVYVMGGL